MKEKEYNILVFVSPWALRIRLIKTYYEKITYHTAFRAKRFCPYCGCHGYEIHKALAVGDWDWNIEYYVKCEGCGAEGESAHFKEDALRKWEEL